MLGLEGRSIFIPAMLIAKIHKLIFLQVLEFRNKHVSICK